MSVPFVLHVGMSKTATTSMQEGLFPSHREIGYIGKSIKNKTPKQCTSATLYEVFAPALWLHGRKFDAARAADVGRELLGDGAQKRKVVLGSWEEFGSLPDSSRFSEILLRLRGAFEPCKALFVLRNPITWAPSEYMQRLRWNYFRACERPIGYRTFMEFDAWCANVESFAKGSGLFSYGPNLQAAVQVLGVENVGVLLYEELVSDIDAFCTQLCSFLGVGEEGVREMLESTHRNARMTESQLQLLKDIDCSPIRKLVWRVSPVAVRRQRFKLADRRSGAASRQVRFSLNNEQIDFVSKRTRGMNAWIRDKFGLPVERYGYPL